MLLKMIEAEPGPAPTAQTEPLTIDGVDRMLHQAPTSLRNASYLEINKAYLGLELSYRLVASQATDPTIEQLASLKADLMNAINVLLLATEGYRQIEGLDLESAETKETYLRSRRQAQLRGSELADQIKALNNQTPEAG